MPANGSESLRIVGEHNQHVARRLTGFAVLTVDWQERHASYLDNFIDFVLSSISSSTLGALTSQQVSTALFESYGIRLPERVIGQILKRGAKLEFLEKSAAGLVQVSQKGQKKVSAIHPKLAELSREQSKLAETFVGWAKDQHQVDLTSNEAIEYLMNYVDTYYGSLMSTAIGSGSVGTLPPPEPTFSQKMSALFVKWVSENDPQCLTFLINVAKGSMLFAALFTPKLIQMDHQFRGTMILLDTKILFRALGYEGKDAQDATLEYINLLVVQGARIATFDFTLQEAKSVLSNACQLAKTGKLWTSRPGTVGSSYFLSNASPGRIDLDSAQFENHLRSLNISVVTNPPYDARYVVDEDEIEAKILTKARKYRDGALRHDVKALTAIIRLRHGEARDSLEECRAVFVTLNVPLLMAAHDVQDLRDEPWHVAMHDTDVATLAWIKSPPSAPELPKQLMLATCLSVLRPTDSTWQGYIHVFEGALASDELSEEDLLLLREKYEKDNMFSVQNPNSHGNSIKASISVSLEKAKLQRKEAIENPLRKELTEAANREANLKRDLEESRRVTAELMASKAREESQIRTKCKRWGEKANYGLVALLSLILLTTYFIPDFSARSLIWRIIAGGGSVIAVICGGLLRPGKWIGSKVESRLLAKKGFTILGKVVEPA